MLKLGFDVNARGGEGFTPVNHAALRGLVGIVRLLIEHGADLEIRNQYGGTALESCQWGSLNFRDPEGDYPACAEALLLGRADVGPPGFRQRRGASGPPPPRRRRRQPELSVVSRD